METTFYIKLHSMDTVRKFVNGLVKYDGEFDAISEKYLIDAKSFLGLLSLDLSQPFQLRIATEDKDAVEFIKTFQSEK